MAIFGCCHVYILMDVIIVHHAVLRSLLVEHRLQEFEMGAVANLCPEKAEEVRDLVPSVFATEVRASGCLQ